MKTSPKDWLLAFVILFILTCAMTIVYRVDPAGAAFKPAPAGIVTAARHTRAPARGTTAYRAWIICHEWKGVPCRKVLNMAWCESSLKPDAANGIYLGMFQMDPHNRAVYGHSRSAWVQAKAGYHLWLDRHWNPWECTPA